MVCHDARMAAQETPSTYAELGALLDNLPLLVREARRRKGHRLLDAAAEANVSASTISRLENGIGDPAFSAVRALIGYVS